MMMGGRRGDCSIQTTLMPEIPLKVRGSVRINETMVPMIPKTMVQVPWLVSTFISTEKVRMWAAMMKTKMRICAISTTHRPTGPKMTAAACAKLCSPMCFCLNFW